MSALLTRRARGPAAVFLALAVALAPAAAGQRPDPQVTAQLETGLLRLGESVSCMVVVENADEAQIVDIPAVDGLRLLERRPPRISSHNYLRGGQRSFTRTISWVLIFRPDRAGDFTFPPMRLRVDGRDAYTREMHLSVVEDMEGRDLGHLELVETPRRVFEGQPFTLRMLLGWDNALGESVNYANLILPWWGELPGTLEMDIGEARRGASRTALHLNSRQQVMVQRLGTRELRDRRFVLYELERTYVATRPGRLSFPVSHLEFGRVIDRAFERRKQTYYVGLPAFEIEVRPLPEEGRPFDFSGAVGRLIPMASADRRDVDAGDSIKLTVEWSGFANLEFFDPPELGRMESFEGFRVYGTTDRYHGDRRVVVYDLAPISSDVDEIPPVPLVLFDPELEQYRTVRTGPIPIRVRPLAGTSGLEGDAGAAPGAALDIRDIQTGGDGRRRAISAGPGGRAVGGAMVALPLFWLGLRAFVRRRGEPGAPEAKRRRAAPRRLRRELARARTAAQQSAALHRFLAARTGERPEAWEGRDPLAERERGGALARLSEDDARALASLLAELEARRWAGGDEALEAAQVIELAERLAKGGL